MTDHKKLYLKLMGEMSEVIERLIAAMREAEDAILMAEVSDETVILRSEAK